MPARTARTENCKTCKYLRAHPKCGLSTMILEGTSYADVAKRFRGKDGKWRAGNYLTIKKHWEAQHMVSRQLLAAKDISDRKKGLELLTCQEEVYNLSIRAAKIALGDVVSENKKVKPDIRSFGSCLGPAAKVVEVLAKVSPDGNKDVEPDGMIEALKATANDDWKDARPVQVETIEPEAANGSELDAA